MKALRLPSVAQVWASLVDVFQRFPWTMIAALAGTLAALGMVESGEMSKPESWLLVRVIFCGLLAVPLTIALRLVAEARALPPARRVALELAGIAGVAAYFLLGLPSSFADISEAVFIRTAVLAIGLHLAVAFVPFAGRPDENAFWWFNWRLFERFCLGAVISAVLFAGLSVAMGSASQLFAFKIKPERYADLWLVIVGLFNTVFFLRGVPPPEDGEAEPPAAYPKVLRIFAQFALAPLVVAYLAILYPYAGKILLTHTWPNGWVALPVLCLAVAGVLEALFLHPVREQPGERWASWYWKWFFRALLPLTLLLYLSVRVRVGEYGMTESRYCGFALAIWLATVSACYWWPSNRAIRWIPASLAALCLFGTWGPWGVFSVSEQSQYQRLEQRLAAHGFLVSGILTPKPQPLDSREYDELQSLLRYLRERHHSARLGRLLAPYRAAADHKQRPARAGISQIGRAEADDVMGWLGAQSAQGRAIRWFSIALDSEPIGIAGYSKASRWNLHRYTKDATPVAAGLLRFEIDRKTGRLVAATASRRLKVSQLDGLLAAAAGVKAREGRLPWKDLSAPAAIEGRDLLLVVESASGRMRKDGDLEIDSIALLVLER